MATESLKTTGLVIMQKNYRESDRLLTLLTPNGPIRVWARAAENVKSKKFAGTAMFCYSDFLLHRGGDGLYIVDSAEPKEIFFGLRNDIERLSLAQYFCELLCAVAPEGTDTEELLRLALNSLYCLCGDEKSIYAVKAVFEWRLMCELGFLPNLIGCVECGEYSAATMLFDPFEGVLYCGVCAPKKAGLLKLTSSQLAVLRHIALSDFNRIFGFTASEETLRAVSAVTEKYVEARVERAFKTLRYFNSVRI